MRPVSPSLVCGAVPVCFQLFSDVDEPGELFTKPGCVRSAQINFITDLIEGEMYRADAVFGAVEVIGHHNACHGSHGMKGTAPNVISRCDAFAESAGPRR